MKIETISLEIDFFNAPTTNWFNSPSMKHKPWMQASICVALVTLLCSALSNHVLFQISLVLAIALGSVAPLHALLLEWSIKENKPTIKSLPRGMLAVAGVVVLIIWKQHCVHGYNYIRIAI